MGYAPVIAFTAARRKAMALQLYRWGVTQTAISEADRTGPDTLAELWARTRTIRSLTRITGRDASFYRRYTNVELVELEGAHLRNLMGADRRNPEQVVHPIDRYQQARRHQHLQAWDIPA